MKRLYRSLMIVFCIVLWALLRVAAADIAETARISPYRVPFQFPNFLQGTEIYVWSLSYGAEGSELVIQNIGDEVLTEIEITFLSYGKRLVFAGNRLMPGEKRRLNEVSGAVYDGKNPVICTGVSVNRNEIR